MKTSLTTNRLLLQSTTPEHFSTPHKLYSVPVEQEIRLSSYTYFFTNAGLDELFAGMVQNGVTVVSTLQNFPWGCGNLQLRTTTVISSALERMCEEPYFVQTISNKSTLLPGHTFALCKISPDVVSSIN